MIRGKMEVLRGAENPLIPQSPPKKLIGLQWVVLASFFHS